MKRQMIVPEGFRKLTPEEKRKICNGAGSSQAGFDFVPDTMYGLNLNAAADIHDYMYFVGKTRLDKIIADIVYLHNMFAYIEQESYWFMVWLRENRALVYVDAVNIAGDDSFFLREKANHYYKEHIGTSVAISFRIHWLEIIKKFVLFSDKKNVKFKLINKGYDLTDINSNFINVIYDLIKEYEAENNLKVVSDYESWFQSVFKKT